MKTFRLKQRMKNNLKKIFNVRFENILSNNRESFEEPLVEVPILERQSSTSATSSKRCEL